MKNLYRKFLQQIDAQKLYRNTEKLYREEQGVTFPAYHRAAQTAYQLLQDAQIPNAEIITFPADGKTSYQDKVSPLGWDATVGKLTIIDAPLLENGLVVADFQEHPFHLIKGSVATAPGGEKVRIITYEEMLAGKDPHDALVIAPPDSLLCSKPLTLSLDLGARGIISDFAMNAEDAPDGLQWCNAFTELDNWHILSGDREFIAFSVTPQMGTKLRRAAALGEITARMESDGRRYEDTVDVVTAMVPGKRKEEFWIFAHLYEPLSNDNSSGVCAAIETARLFANQETPEFSLRVIFGLEYYGFAAYAQTRGHFLGNEVIGGCNYDAMCVRSEWHINFRCAAAGSPFYGNYLAKMLSNDLKNEPMVPAINFQNSFDCMYDDDSFLTDSTVGIPTVWPIRVGKNFWHNSKQVMSYVEKDMLARCTAIHAAYVSAVINPQKEHLAKVLPLAAEQLAAEIPFAVGSQKEHLKRRYDILIQDLEDFKQYFSSNDIDPIKEKLSGIYEILSIGLTDEIPRSKWRDYAENIYPVRTETGFPHALAKAPADERIALPGRVLYGPLAAILSNMDGKRSLSEIFRMVEHETRQLMSEKEIRKMCGAVRYLADWGYVSFQGYKGLSKEDIIKSLHNAGIKSGDYIMVHSSISEFGIIDGGVETAIQALYEAVGENGCCIFPAFTDCFTYLGEPNHSENYRPFDPNDFRQIWTGVLPRTLLKKHPDAIRSKHITHSWCGLGENAKLACAEHGMVDPPVGSNSPLAYCLKKNGKIVHFGSTLGSTTFLHLIEDELNLPGVQTTFCKIKKANGYSETVASPRNLPGDRDFYHGSKDTIRFFKAAIPAGLEIKEATLGNGTIMAMDMVQLYNIGYKLLSEQPDLLLSSDPENLSCNRIKKENE